MNNGCSILRLGASRGIHEPLLTCSSILVDLMVKAICMNMLVYTNLSIENMKFSVIRLDYYLRQTLSYETSQMHSSG